jgi:hypothetical protein
MMMNIIYILWEIADSSAAPAVSSQRLLQGDNIAKMTQNRPALTKSHRAIARRAYDFAQNTTEKVNGRFGLIQNACQDCPCLWAV